MVFLLPSKQMNSQSQYKNTGKRCVVCLKLTIKTPKQRQWCRSGVFIDKFEDISHLFVSSVSIVDFEQVNVCWKETWISSLEPHILCGVSADKFNSVIPIPNFDKRVYVKSFLNATYVSRITFMLPRKTWWAFWINRVFMRELNFWVHTKIRCIYDIMHSRMGQVKFVKYRL